MHANPKLNPRPGDVVVICNMFQCMVVSVRREWVTKHGQVPVVEYVSVPVFAGGGTGEMRSEVIRLDEWRNRVKDAKVMK